MYDDTHTHLHIRDPKWLLILRAITHVLGIVLMLILLVGAITLYQKAQEVDNIFEDDSSSVIEEEPVEEFQPEPGPGQTEQSLDWYDTDEEGNEVYCYTIPEPYEEICEPTGN